MDPRELIVAFNFYSKTPFGKLHSRSPDIVALSQRLGRTPSSVAMKATNFASVDPMHQRRGVAGLSGASRQDREIWQEFHRDWEGLAFESERAADERVSTLPPADAPTERDAVRRVRLVQRFFRRAVLVAYGAACAVCNVGGEALVVVSHIIRWADDPRQRADQRNGICLCGLHEREFDSGLMTFDAERA